MKYKNWNGADSTDLQLKAVILVDWIHMMGIQFEAFILSYPITFDDSTESKRMKLQTWRYLQISEKYIFFFCTH